ncbi:hypothetical protein ACS8E2_05465 [Psychrobacter glaciei]|uniref:hypothetical protein n=1 Tax=Psychrobacter glaciei TaxID=619771 RepID=UPI003F47F649
MRSEYDAMNQLSNSSQQAKQDAIRAMNDRYLLDEQLESQRLNEIFWRGVMRFITHITLASIVIYALFHFA